MTKKWGKTFNRSGEGMYTIKKMFIILTVLSSSFACASHKAEVKAVETALMLVSDAASFTQGGSGLHVLCKLAAADKGTIVFETLPDGRKREEYLDVLRGNIARTFALAEHTKETDGKWYIRGQELEALKVEYEQHKKAVPACQPTLLDALSGKLGKVGIFATGAVAGILATWWVTKHGGPDVLTQGAEGVAEQLGK